MGRLQTSIQDRMGLLQVAAINTAMAALTKTVGVFPKERAIIDRERAEGSYALGPYLLSKLIAEIPVGAAFPLLFGGILYPMPRLHPTISRFGKFCGICNCGVFCCICNGLDYNTPIIFRWIPRVSLIRWAFQGFCINEFSGLQFEHQKSFHIQSGEEALERLSFGGSQIRDTIVAQSRILMFWYYTTYLLLEKNKPKYQRLESPPRLKDIEEEAKLQPVKDDDLLEPTQQVESPPLDEGKPDEQHESSPADPLDLFNLDGF
ncbi:hypothetical protein K7X08_009867 [Anisodus acutangulus]|uniref:ABC-2 type transporter transmembrane domain-containing protein n=1 Tax=Anisodus acutangulus TaxID=402998 RepID=A0A9Q1N1P3_9SOLA|nr:hypothetical protein K7X08_009867 [Anisodus acutangulus]